MSRQSNDLRETIETLKNKGDIVLREGDTGEVLGLDHEIVPTVYPIVSRRRRRFFYREQLQNLFLP